MTVDEGARGDRQAALAVLAELPTPLWVDPGTGEPPVATGAFGDLAGDAAEAEVLAAAAAGLAERLRAGEAAPLDVPLGDRDVRLEAAAVPSLPGAPRAVAVVARPRAAGSSPAPGRPGAASAPPLALDLELRNHQLDEAGRLKRDFVALMSHELRTPLNAVIGFAELLHDGVLPPGSPKHQEFLASILSSGRHLLRLVDDILDLTKAEAGKLELRPRRVALPALVAGVAAVLGATAASRRLEVRVDVDGVGEVYLDPSRLEQILYNLLSNALKFTPEGGHVEVRVRPDGDDRFRLEVTDDGPGIAADDLPRLFVDFEQLHAGLARRHRGTGLGLALTRRLVQAQGGAVGVDSAPGRGSTFFVVLPRRIPGGAARVVRRTRPPASGVPTVLVVEPSRVDQAALVAALSHAGFGVEPVDAPGDAEARVVARRYDAVTLDLGGSDGRAGALLATLRASALNHDTPVVAVSSAWPADPQRALVQAVLRKPVDAPAVAAAVRSLAALDDAG